MSKLGWFAAGLGLGAAAKDSSQAVAAGYQEREAELTKPATKASGKTAAKKPAAKPAAKRAPAKK